MICPRCDAVLVSPERDGEHWVYECSCGAVVWIPIREPVMVPEKVPMAA